MKYPSHELIYFNIEGAAEPVRLAFSLAEVPYKDTRVNFPEWGALKPTTPYGQLPLLKVDGGDPKTQSSAMLRYIGTLNPDAELYPLDRMYAIEEALGLVDDLKRSWSPSLYMGMRPENFGYAEGFAKTDEGKKTIQSMREKFIEIELPRFLGYFAAMVEKNGGKWLCSSDKPTIADCYAVPALRYYTRGTADYVDAKCLDISPVIVDYIKRFCALEQIKGRYSDGVH